MPGPWLAALLILVASLWPYLGALQADFVLDDVAVVRDNPLIRDLSGLGRLFLENYWAPISDSNLYRPLTVATYALNRALTGPGAPGFHAVNLGLHAAVSLLVLVLARRLGAGAAASALAGLLFAVHPIHVEAVTGIVGRAELLAALGGLGALCLHLGPRAGRGSPLGVALALLLAMLSKEVAIGLWPVLLARDLARHGGGRSSCARLRLGPHLLVAVVVALYAAARLQVLGADSLASPPILSRIDNALVVEAWPARTLTALSVLGRYLALVAWPARLSADYSYAAIDLVRTPLDAHALAGLLALLLLAGGLVAAIRRGHLASAVALALFLGPYFIVSNLVVLIGAAMAERFLYLPSAGLALAIALAVGRAARWLPRPAAAAPAVAAALIALGVRTSLRNRDFRDQDTLLERTVETVPRSLRARAYLAFSRKAAGDRAGAERQLAQALEVDPQEPWTFNALGKVRLPEDTLGATQALRRALALDPGYAEARVHLAWAHLLEGRPEEAVLELKAALRTRARYPEALIALAEAYLALEQPAEARRWLEAGMRMQPFRADAEETLGRLLEREGRPEEALDAYARAAGMDPRLAAASFGLGRLHERAGRAGPAIAAYRLAAGGHDPPLEAFTRGAALLAGQERFAEAAALLAHGQELLGESALLGNNRGMLALLRGDPAAARAAWRRSLELEPDNPFARERLDILDQLEKR